MSTPEPPTTGASTKPPVTTPTPPAPPPHTPRPPPEPLTGFKSALEHTGIPRSVLTWKPRLPSRNWTIFFTIVGTVTYLYYDDRKQCKEIREAALERVRSRSLEPTSGSMDVIRKVKVYGAKWPEDDDTDRALRHFRKYIKPYLIAAAVDYEQIKAPLHGSITRQVHAAIVKKRRQALGLEPAPMALSLPGTLDPTEVERRELEGGVVLVGRATLKEYMEGLKRGWSSGVDEWDWEKEVEKKLEFDGVFKSPPQTETTDGALPSETDNVLSQPSTPPALPGGLGFLSRPPIPTPFPSPNTNTTPVIPQRFHTPPSPLPPQPPILLLPFTSHLGFKQIPQMIYDFFTERHRVQSGADAAVALIESQTRPLIGPNQPDTDLDFDRESEKWYKKDFTELPKRMETARKDYYETLAPKLESARELAIGKRELTDEEKKSNKMPVSEADLLEERRKKELRWQGSEEGYEIVKQEKEVTWDAKFDGWLRVFELRSGGVGDDGTTNKV